MNSEYTVQQMAATNTIGYKYKFPCCLNFNEKGNLICVGYKNKQINIFDWNQNELKYDFNSNHTEDPTNVKFINKTENRLDIITTSDDGQIRRAIISPSGKLTSTRLFYKAFTSPKVVTIPESPDSLLAVTTDGSLFIMDLRCTSKKDKFALKTRIHHKNGDFIPFCDVAFHPTAPEICTCSHDPFIRTFDIRNLSKCTKEMYSNIPKRRKEIYRCSYNFNGDEILASYLYESCYIFNNQNYKSSPITYEESSYFFGPKSEFIVSAMERQICFYRTHCPSATENNFCVHHTHCPTALKCIGFGASMDKWSFKPHRNLPLIAALTAQKGVKIFSPTEGDAF